MFDPPHTTKDAKSIPVGSIPCYEFNYQNMLPGFSHLVSLPVVPNCLHLIDPTFIARLITRTLPGHVTNRPVLHWTGMAHYKSKRFTI